MNPPAILQTAQDTLTKRFRYVDQTGEHGPQRTWLADVLAGKKWYGDCDDFASTACHYLREVLKWKHPIFYQYCQTQQGVWHVVCLALDEDGKGWVLDNRYMEVYLSTRMYGYRWDMQVEWWRYLITPDGYCLPVLERAAS